MTIGGAGAINGTGMFFNAPVSTTTAATKTSTSTTSSAAGSAMTKQLSTPDLFLKLLMSELQHQNPTHPTTASSILQQTAELSQIESITTMTTALDKQRQYVEASDATGLIGKQVSATATGKPVTGTVAQVSLSSTGTPVLEIAGPLGSVPVPLSSVTAVGPAPATATTTTGTTGTTTGTTGTTTTTTTGTTAT
jgi:flagellar basal-body rod modification protein FlgD